MKKKMLAVLLAASMVASMTACGSSNSAIELTCAELFALSKAKEWIDVCKGWQETEEI